jgi:HK97 family phage portal protein
LAKNEKRARWWQKIFKKPDQTSLKYIEDVLSGRVPLYSTGFGENVYASDVVQQAIYSIVSELKKLDPVHVRKIGSDYVDVAGDIQNVLDAPNPLMTTTDFIEKVAWLLLLNYNAWVYPLWDGNKLVALYPLQPSEVEFDTDYKGSGENWVRMLFPNGTVTEMRYDDIIHLRYRFSVSEFMGGNENGKPDFAPLLDTLKLNDTLLKGLAKSLNMQTSLNGVLKLKNMVNFDDKVLKIKEFEKRLQANESGFLAVDIVEEFMPLTKQVNLLDSTTLEFIDRKILRNWGVSIPIVNGDYNKEQYEAFYQKAVEPIVKTFKQGFTKGIFTKHRAQGFNNRIEFYVKELIFMNTDQKLNLFKDLSAQGGVFVNEYRTAFGMRPINALQGVRMQSLNWVSSDYAKQYQTGEKGDTGKNNGSNEGAKNQEEDGGVNNE